MYTKSCKQKQGNLYTVIKINYRFTMSFESVFRCQLNPIVNKKKTTMDFKKLVGQVLVVTAGVALYMLAVKPMLDSAKVTK